MRISLPVCLQASVPPLPRAYWLMNVAWPATKFVRTISKDDSAIGLEDCWWKQASCLGLPHRTFEHRLHCVHWSAVCSGRTDVEQARSCRPSPPDFVAKHKLSL